MDGLLQVRRLPRSAARPLESATGVSVMRLKREMMVRIRSCKREGDAKWLYRLSRTPAT